MLNSLVKFSISPDKLWSILAVALLLVMQLHPMKRGPDLENAISNSKHPKQEQVTLLSSDGKSISMSADLAKLSPVFAAIIDKEGTEKPIKIKAEMQLLEIIEKALKSIKQVSQGKPFPSEYGIDLLMILLKPPLEAVPLHLNLLKIASDLRIEPLITLLTAYAKIPRPSNSIITISPGSIKLKAPKLLDITGNVTLISNDMIEFTLRQSEARIALTIGQLIDDIGADDAIPLKEVSSKELAFIVKALQHIAAIHEHNKDFNEQILIALNLLFAGLSYEGIIKIFKAASYLDIPLLLDYTVSLIALQLTVNTNIDAVSILTEALNNKQLLPSDLAALILHALKALNQPLLQQTSQAILVGHSCFISSVAISGDGQYALTGSLDKTARLWHVKTGRTIKLLVGHTQRVNAVALSPNGKYALTGSKDRTAILWDLTQTAQELKPYKTFKHLENEVNSVAFCTNGHALIGLWRGTVCYWNLKIDKLIKCFDMQFAPIFSIAISDDKHMVTASNGVCYCDLKSKRILNTFPFPTTVYSVAISSDGKYMMAGIGNTVCYFDLVERKAIKCLEGRVGNIQSVALSSDGKYAITSGEDATARLWDLSTDTCIKVWEKEGCDRMSVAISRDGKHILIGGHGYLSATALVYDLTNLHDRLTVAQIVLLIKLSQVGMAKALGNAFFSKIFNESSQEVKDTMNRLFGINNTNSGQTDCTIVSF